MAKYLIIVESPSKAKTIKKYLGSSYTVKSSVGHIIDLPKSKLGVDTENGFIPQYITVRGKTQILKEIKNAAKGVTKILLATDPDREGEAIAWHLAGALKIPSDELCRVEFNEITESTVKEAIKHPRTIDQNLVDAQQARRIMDRIVGYKLSPLLWKKIAKGLSAGRVQSVAVKLIIDKETEIEGFTEEEYWDVEGIFRNQVGEAFKAGLYRKGSEKINLPNEGVTKEMIDDIRRFAPVVDDIKLKEKKANPKPPFITSTLQQKAATVLNFTSRKTMQIAQELYEGVDLGKENGGLTGLITYMRTDSTRISPVAKEETKDYILEHFGKEYIPGKPRYYKNSNKAQDAHEAIRPTSIFKSPKIVGPYLSKDQLRLYKLIWETYLASEMPSAIYDQMTVEILMGDYRFKAIGSKLKFKGYLAAGGEKEESENLLPSLATGESLVLVDMLGNQHFTQPPQRYSEATLIKKLESLGIGRPSTYSSILETIVKRAYVVRDKKMLYSTDLGRRVHEMLSIAFADLINVKFTSKLENELDLVAEGKREWKKIIAEFYGPFKERMERAYEELEKNPPPPIELEVTDVICEKCGRNMVIRTGKFGKFLACPGFPECRNIKNLVEKAGVDCPKCGGDIVVKRSKAGRVFYGCSNYPTCDASYWNIPTGEKCPDCGEPLVDKGKTIACSVCRYKRPNDAPDEE